MSRKPVLILILVLTVYVLLSAFHPGGLMAYAFPSTCWALLALTTLWVCGLERIRSWFNKRLSVMAALIALFQILLLMNVVLYTHRNLHQPYRCLINSPRHRTLQSIPHKKSWQEKATPNTWANNPPIRIHKHLLDRVPKSPNYKGTPKTCRLHWHKVTARSFRKLSCLLPNPPSRAHSILSISRPPTSLSMVLTHPTKPPMGVRSPPRRNATNIRSPIHQPIDNPNHAKENRHIH